MADDITKNISIRSKIAVEDNYDEVSRSMDKFAKGSTKQSGIVLKGLASISDGVSSIKSSLSQHIPLGLGLGITGLVKQAHSLNMEWAAHRASLKALSNEYGDASGAVKMMTSVWGKSGLSLEGVKGVMDSMNAQGLPLNKAGFEDLAIVVGNVHQASGIAIDSLSALTAGMMNTWQASSKSTTSMIDNLLTMQKTFGVTNREIEVIMKTVTEVINKTAMLFDHTDESMKAMTKGLSSATGAMKKFGISAQQSTSFFEKILDPENINENLKLFTRLGISYEETMDMMTSEKGKETFFDKLMTNLPALSQQITSLRNPMARLQFAKNLGLPLEIAQKMAKATSGEIQTMMKDHKEKMAEETAIKAKQAKMQADTARFAEAMNFLKMKALLPFMEFANKNLGTLFDFLRQFAGLFAKVGKVVTFFMQSLIDNLKGPLTSLLAGDFKNFAKGIGEAIPKILAQWMPVVADILGKVVTTAISAFKGIIKGLWSSGPLGKFLVLGAAYFAAQKTKSIIVGFKEAFLGAKGSLRNPMYVKDIGLGGATGGMAGKLLGKIPGINKIPFLGKLLGGGAVGGLGPTGIPGFGQVTGMAGKGAGILGKLGARVIPGIGLLAGAAMGTAGGVEKTKEYYQGRKVKDEKGKDTKENYKVTKKDLVSGGLIGALTLGIVPMLDDIFGTQITGRLGEAMKDFSESAIGKFTGIGLVINGITAVAEAFSDKALTAEEERDQKLIDGKIERGEKLSKADLKRQKELFNAQVANNTSFIDGLKNLKNKISETISSMWDGLKTFFSDIPTGVKNALSAAKEKISALFQRIGDWADMKIGLPFFKMFGGLMTSMEVGFAKLNNTSFGRWLSGATKEVAQMEEDRAIKNAKNYKEFDVAARGMGNRTELARLAKQGSSVGKYAAMQLKKFEMEDADRKEARDLAKKTEQNTRKGAGYGAGILNEMKKKEGPQKLAETDFLDLFFKRPSYGQIIIS